ncbi:lysyl oxidase-like protein 2 3 4 [Fusarium austroafricanum]|uniref:Lysyl oxidase-like protein 2 3 4 n=1 Tax=Fusarium austroafricanum TaxID=2364996 RepID=A0A8H4K2T0_9HYPO|nr:lysyl oxidase-like protein 2 3 4 [Fusarium austroafricanum]
MSYRDPVYTTAAAAPLPQFSQAVKYNGMVYCSGSIGIDPATDELVPGTVTDRARMALHNLKAVLEAAGSSMDRVVKANIFLADMNDFGGVNIAWDEFFPDHPKPIAMGIDPLDEADSPGLQGRRRIELGRDFVVYANETIDKFLTDIDHHAESGQPSDRGPFSAFMTTHDESCELEASVPSTAETSSPDDTNWMSPAARVILSEAPQTYDSESVPNTTPWLPLDLPTSPSSLVPTDKDFPTDDYKNKLGEDLMIKDFIVGIGDENPSVQETSLTPYASEPVMPQILNTTLSGNLQTDYLIKHYNVHVAGLLLPVNHSENPFRNLYLSTALEGILHLNLHTGTSREMTYTALYQSLLASAAYHRWQCNKQDLIYRELGAKYRYYSIQSLQAAVTEAPPTVNYQALILAVLSLVTIGVISGEGVDFRLHIQVATQLRKLRSKWRLLSRPSRRLNEIGAFLALLSDSMSFEPSSSSWGNNDDSIVSEYATLQLSECFEYTYGITPAITMAIHEACRLSKHLIRFRQESEDLPDDFLEACEELGNKLESWRFEAEAIMVNFCGDELSLSVFPYYAKAWHGAALIYYYSCIQGIERADLVREVDKVGEDMHSAEDLKAVPGSLWQEKSMAPITWPAFVASCNAIKDRRGIWERWWKRVLCYNLGNMTRQWDLVQKIWGILDDAECQRIYYDALYASTLHL